MLFAESPDGGIGIEYVGALDGEMGFLSALGAQIAPAIEFIEALAAPIGGIGRGAELPALRAEVLSGAKLSAI
jgi:hypothetical protein